MPEQLQGADANSRREPRISVSVYARPMRGGGYVRVELLEADIAAAASGKHLRGREVMERRVPAPATPEEEPLVVEELEGDDSNGVVAELIRIARDNAAIARRVLRQQQPIGRVD